MRQNIADFLYSNFLGRTSQKSHPVYGQNFPLKCLVEFEIFTQVDQTPNIIGMEVYLALQ